MARKWGENEEIEEAGKWSKKKEMERLRGNGERMRKSQTQFTASVASVAKILLQTHFEEIILDQNGS